VFRHVGGPGVIGAVQQQAGRAVPVSFWIFAGSRLTMMEYVCELDALAALTVASRIAWTDSSGTGLSEKSPWMVRRL
jgi:hypothetical protein